MKKLFLSLIISISLATQAFAVGLISDGADDHSNCGTANTILQENAAQSVICLTKANSEGESSGRIISKESGAGTGVRFVVNDLTAGGNAELGLQVSGTTSMLRPQADGELVVGVWHLVGYSWDGSTTATNADIWVDGTEANYGTAQNMVTATDNAAGIVGFFGRDNRDRTYDGTHQFCYVWTSDLTDAQMAWGTSLGQLAGTFPHSLAYALFSISPSTLNMAMIFDSYASGTATNGLVYKDRTGNWSCTSDDGAGNSGITASDEPLTYN